MPVSKYIALRTFSFEGSHKRGDELSLTEREAKSLNRNQATVIRKPERKQAKPNIQSKELKLDKKETK